jgi:serine/threonine protein kinase
LIKKCRVEKDFVAEDVIWKIFMQVLLALQECHTSRPDKPNVVLHRDLKPGNVFFD